MLTKYDITVSKDDIERVDTLRYAWKNLLMLAKEVQDSLLELQPVFKNDLIAKVEQFKVDSVEFVASYQKVCRLFPFFLLVFRFLCFPPSFYILISSTSATFTYRMAQ